MCSVIQQRRIAEQNDICILSGILPCNSEKGQNTIGYATIKFEEKNCRQQIKIVPHLTIQ